MATGQLPFAGANPAETLDMILHAEPEAMARLNSHVPAELERMVRKCLEKDRERRYQTMRDLVIDLLNVQRECKAGRTTASGAGAKVSHPGERRRIITSWWAL